MKHRLMDLLACPVDKFWPLKLEIEEDSEEEEDLSLPVENSQTGVICNFYCNFKQFYLVEINKDGEELVKSKNSIGKQVTLDDCQECFKIEIQKGQILCSEDNTHIYDIKEGIPVMLTQQQIEEIYGKKYKRHKK